MHSDTAEFWMVNVNNDIVLRLLEFNSAKGRHLICETLRMKRNSLCIPILIAAVVTSSSAVFK